MFLKCSQSHSVWLNQWLWFGVWLCVCLPNECQFSFNIASCATILHTLVIMQKKKKKKMSGGKLRTSLNIH